MPLIKDQAIAIRRLDFSETSQVLAFFTRHHGKQRLIAKGIKRGTKTRFATGIELLERGRVVFSRHEQSPRELGTLTEWLQEDVHARLRTDLRWLLAGQYIAEAVDLTTEQADPSARLFDATEHCLTVLPEEGPAALVRFQKVLLEEIGWMPDLARCVACGRSWSGKTRPTFSAREGGLICRNCEGPLVEKRRVAREAVLAASSGDVPEDTAAAAFDLLDYHLTETLGRPLRLSMHVRRDIFGGVRSAHQTSFGSG